MDKYRFCVVVALALGLAACQVAPVNKRSNLYSAKLSCSVSEQGPRPSWVPAGLNVPGYYVGVGAAQISQDHGGDLAVATQNAMADISASVRTSINQMVSSSVRERRHGDAAAISQEESEVITRATTRMSLDNAKRVASWMDGKNCQLWVQVRVDEATVERNLARQQSERQLNQAEVLYETTEQAGLGLDQRIHNMEVALGLLDDVQFNFLPMQKRAFYQSRYQERMKSLHRQEQSREVLILINAQNPHAKSLKPEVARHLAYLVNGSWYKQKQECRAASPCLNIARKERAKKLVIVNLQTATRTARMGSEFGDVDMIVAFYDVASGKVLAQPKRSKGEVFSFDGDLDWGLAVQRAFDQEPIKQVLKQYGSCSVEGWVGCGK